VITVPMSSTHGRHPTRFPAELGGGQIDGANVWTVFGHVAFSWRGQALSSGPFSLSFFLNNFVFGAVRAAPPHAPAAVYNILT
jgi:hypothetical protein